MAVAFHEAGHAVVALALGINVVSVSVVPEIDEGGRSDGRMTPAPPATEAARLAAGLDPDPALVRALGVSICAGPIAQRRALPRSWRSHHGRSDVEDVGDIVMLLSTWPGDLKTIGPALELEASRLLDKHWLAMEAVAAALLNRSTLSSEELRRIVQFPP